MKIAEDVHVIEHRRVQGGDWLRVQHVGADMLEWAQDVVARYNEESGCGDWRIRPIGEPPAAKIAEPRMIEKPSVFDRVRFWWLMRFSKRGRG